MAKKWIIQGDDLRIGHVELHRELAGKDGEIRGGGLWELNDEKNAIFLYGKSYDFGKCTVEDIKNARLNGYSGATLDEIDWQFSLTDSLVYYMEEPDIVV